MSEAEKGIRIEQQVTEITYEAEVIAAREQALAYLASWRLRLDDRQEVPGIAHYDSLPNSDDKTRTIVLIAGTAHDDFELYLGEYGDNGGQNLTRYFYEDGKLTHNYKEGTEFREPEDNTQAYSYWRDIQRALFDCDKKAKRLDS